MEKVTIDLPKDMEFIKGVSSLDWSLIATKMLKSKIKELSRLKRITSKSKLTEEDVEKFTDKINESIAKHYSKYE